MRASRVVPALALTGTLLVWSWADLPGAGEKQPQASDEETGAPSPAVLVTPERIDDVEYWKEAVAASPEDVTIRLALGNAYATNNRLREAIGEYRRILRTYPDYKIAWNNLGSAYRARNQKERALLAYRKALAIDAYYALAHYNIGVIYDSAGSYERAIESYGRALRYDPKLIEVRNNPQVVSNRHLFAVLLHNYVESAGTLALPLEPAYPVAPEE